jgi:hypothetical protein
MFNNASLVILIVILSSDSYVVKLIHIRFMKEDKDVYKEKIMLSKID